MSGPYGKKVLREVLDYHYVEEDNEHDEISLQGFGFNLFVKDKERMVREVLS